jgi:hypothetical protein
LEQAEKGDQTVEDYALQKWERGGPMPYTLTREPTFLRIVVHGAITPQDFHALAQDLAGIEKPDAIAPNRLLDLSAVTAPYLTYPDLQAFAARRIAQALPNPVKLAIMAPRPILLGFARMYQTLNQHPQITIEIFATVDAAETWLHRE